MFFLLFLICGCQADLIHDRETTAILRNQRFSSVDYLVESYSDIHTVPDMCLILHTNDRFCPRSMALTRDLSRLDYALKNFLSIESAVPEYNLWISKDILFTTTLINGTMEADKFTLRLQTYFFFVTNSRQIYDEYVIGDDDITNVDHICNFVLITCNFIFDTRGLCSLYMRSLSDEDQENFEEYTFLSFFDADIYCKKLQNLVDLHIQSMDSDSVCIPLHFTNPYRLVDLHIQSMSSVCRPIHFTNPYIIGKIL